MSNVSKAALDSLKVFSLYGKQKKLCNKAAPCLQNEECYLFYNMQCVSETVLWVHYKSKNALRKLQV